MPQSATRRRHSRAFSVTRTHVLIVSFNVVNSSGREANISPKKAFAARQFTWNGVGANRTGHDFFRPSGSSLFPVKNKNVKVSKGIKQYFVILVR